MFNNLVTPPPCLPVPRDAPVSARLEDEEREGLLSSTAPLEETAALPADLGQSGYDVVPQGQHAQAQVPSAR